MPIDLVHFVGSVPLPDARTALRSMAEAAGKHVRRLPDGETGDRLMWTFWLLSRFQENPFLEPRAPGRVAHLEVPRFGVRAGVDPNDVDFGELGYATAARASYEVFGELRESGVIPDGVRLQVGLPTPAALLLQYVDEPDRLVVEEPLVRAMDAEIRRLVAAVPAADLAIQWDSPAEVGLTERVFEHYYPGDDVAEEAVRRLVGLGRLVPPEVELGYHLCYGDTGDVDNPEGSHWKDPVDLTVVTAMMCRIVELSPRPVDFFHVPVPVRRSDEEYFAPLRDLRLPRETQLFLGLLHREDGLEGAEHRVAAARRSWTDFGVATECGMGRERESSVPGLLALHADATRL